MYPPQPSLKIGRGLDCANPVSYTHLDVYKRQAPTWLTSATPLPAIQVLPNSVLNREPSKILTVPALTFLLPCMPATPPPTMPSARAVSYTHLDVYKRQCFNHINLSATGLPEIIQIPGNLYKEGNLKAMAAHPG